MSPTTSQIYQCSCSDKHTPQLWKLAFSENRLIISESDNTRGDQEDRPLNNPCAVARDHPV